MNKDQKMTYLFNRRLDERVHKWQLIDRDFLKYKVEYVCELCGEMHQLDVYNIADERSHKQLLNHLIPKCK